MYQVKLTNNAIVCLKDAIGYISKVLLEPKIAQCWSDRIKKEILSLDHMPLRYPLVDEEPWRTEGIRKMTVESFSFIIGWIEIRQPFGLLLSYMGKEIKFRFFEICQRNRI